MSSIAVLNTNIVIVRGAKELAKNGTFYSVYLDTKKVGEIKRAGGKYQYLPKGRGRKFVPINFDSLEAVVESLKG